MKKTLLIGPAGSGKTYRVLDDFVKTINESEDPLKNDFFFVLPSAEHSGRIISRVLQQGVPGFFNRRITTLTRLIQEAFEFGHHKTATNVTRFLNLREIFRNQEWEYFKEVQHGQGFHNAVLSFISELKESLISSELFRERIDELKKLEPDFGAKYEALASIYENYEAQLQEMGLYDPQDILRIYQSKKQEGLFSKTSFKKIWLDGFFDFSALQLAYIEELCEVSDEVVITLTLDPARERHELFEGVHQTRELLERMGFETEECKRRKNPENKVLAYIEQNIFSSKKPAKPIKPEYEIGVFEAIGMEGEIEMIARSIKKLYQTEQYRFSDFAILLRQIGDYEKIIRSVFQRYQIPVEIHERDRLHFSPLLQVTVRLLKIFRDGWKRNDLISFLKSSYVRHIDQQPKDYEWVSELENRSMQAGVFSDREAWLDDWKLGGKNDDFDKVKKSVLDVFGALENQFRNAKQCSDVKKILENAVRTTFGIFQTTEIWEEYIRREAASYKRFQSIMDEIEASFEKGTIPDAGELFESFADRFFRLVELDLYSLHEPDKNRVQVYDISLARQKEYSVVYIAGLLERKFPVQMREDPILSDWERRLFSGDNEKGVLRERLPRQSMERYLFYVAVTRARDLLILSYPRLDLEGKESLPSYYVEEAKGLFTSEIYLRRQNLGEPFPTFDEAVSRRELEMSVMGGLWLPAAKESQQTQKLLYMTNELLRDEGTRLRFQRSFYQVDDLLRDSKIPELDPFRSRKTSASRLESYGKCAFKYFSADVLNLVDRDEDPNVKNRGIILHEVLENCFKAWHQNPAIYKKPAQAKKEAMKELKQSMKRHSLIGEKRYLYDLEYDDLVETLDLFLDVELERLQTAKLLPKYFEYDFGGKDAPDAEALELVGETQSVFIRGKIDRIDVDKDDQVGIVIDYKRTASFKKSDLELGVGLQLPIYLMVLKKYLGLNPAAAELYSLKDRAKKGFYLKDYQDFFEGMSSRRMILSEKEFEQVVERSQWFIQRYTDAMQRAEITVRPRVCESFCPYSSVCRIEKWKTPLILEEIKEEDRVLRGQGVAEAVQS